MGIIIIFPVHHKKVIRPADIMHSEIAEKMGTLWKKNAQKMF